jgi:hypothetical protein
MIGAAALELREVLIVDDVPLLERGLVPAGIR